MVGQRVGSGTGQSMGLMRGYSEERLGECSEVGCVSERGVFKVMECFVLDSLGEQVDIVDSLPGRR